MSCAGSENNSIDYYEHTRDNEPTSSHVSHQRAALAEPAVLSQTKMRHGQFAL